MVGISCVILKHEFKLFVLLEIPIQHNGGKVSAWVRSVLVCYNIFFSDSRLIAKNPIFIHWTMPNVKTQNEIELGDKT